MLALQARLQVKFANIPLDFNFAHLIGFHKFQSNVSNTEVKMTSAACDGVYLLLQILVILNIR